MLTSVEYADERLPYGRGVSMHDGLWRAWAEHARQYTPGLPYSALVGAAASSVGGRRGYWYPPTGGWWVERAKVRDYLREWGNTEAQYNSDNSLGWYLRGRAALRRLREAWNEARAAARPLGVALEETPAQWLPWHYHVAIGSYSSGQGGMARMLAQARAVTSSPVAQRWTRVAQIVEDAARRAGLNGTVNGLRVRGIAGAASTMRRPRERFELGRAVAAALYPNERGWYAGEPVWPPSEDRRLGAFMEGREP